MDVYEILFANSLLNLVKCGGDELDLKTKRSRIQDALVLYHRSAERKASLSAYGTNFLESLLELMKSNPLPYQGEGTDQMLPVPVDAQLQNNIKCAINWYRQWPYQCKHLNLSPKIRTLKFVDELIVDYLNDSNNNQKIMENLIEASTQVSHGLKGAGAPEIRRNEDSCEDMPSSISCFPQ